MKSSPKKNNSKKSLKKQLRKTRLKLEKMKILKNDFACAQRNEVLKNNDLVDRIDIDFIKINGLEKLITLHKKEIDFLHKQVLIGLEMLRNSIDNTNELKAQNKELVKRLLTFTDVQLTDDQRTDDQLTDDQRTDVQLTDDQLTDEQLTDEQLTDDQRTDDQRTDFVNGCQNGCDCNFIENGCKANSL